MTVNIYRIFAIYKRTVKGLMALVDLVLYPSYFTPTRVKYSLIEDNHFSNDICVVYH